MTKIKLTRDTAIELLERAVQDRGADFVYRKHDEYNTACKYEKNDAPSCLVGVVLAMAGATIWELKRMDQADEPGMDLHWQGLLPVEATNQAIDILSAAQLAQDVGHTWGEALLRARAQARGWELSGDPEQ